MSFCRQSIGTFALAKSRRLRFEDRAYPVSVLTCRINVSGGSYFPCVIRVIMMRTADRARLPCSGQLHLNLVDLSLAIWRVQERFLDPDGTLSARSPKPVPETLQKCTKVGCFFVGILGRSRSACCTRLVHLLLTLASFQAGNQSPKLAQKINEIWLIYFWRVQKRVLDPACLHLLLPNTRPENPNLVDFTLAIWAGPGSSFVPGLCTCC